MTEAEIYQKQVETCKQVQNMINKLYISKDKIIEMIKELEFEIKYPNLDKCSQYYDYINYRKFTLNKLYELLKED